MSKQLLVELKSDTESNHNNSNSASKQQSTAKKTSIPEKSNKVPLSVNTRYAQPKGHFDKFACPTSPIDDLTAGIV